MLANFAVALATVALAAEATEWSGDFGAYGSQSQVHSRSAPAYHPRSSRYGASHVSASYSPKSSGYAQQSYGQNPAYPTRGSYVSKPAAPVRHYDDYEAYPEHSYNFNPRPVAHKPVSTHAPAQHHGYSAYAPKSSYGSYSHAAPSHQGYQLAEKTVVPSAGYDGTWWTPNQQYSPPLIKYAVAAGIPHKGMYAKCPIVVVDGMTGVSPGDVTGDILFSQLPGQTIKVSAALNNEGEISVADDIISYEIMTTGDIQTTAEDDNCEVGDDVEFNPLAEVKNGVVNPYADPKRGRISSSVVSGLGTDTIDIDQTDLLQNLAGHDSIIGRAVIVSKTLAADDTTAVIGCCVIARTLDPRDDPAASSIWLRPRVVATAHNHGYNSYPSQSHSNYGGYGGYHH